MASKISMQESIFKIFEEYKNIFGLIGINEASFARWFNRFKAYDDVRKVNRFFFSGKIPLLSMLKIVKHQYRHFPPDHWEVLRTLNRSMTLVKELNQLLSSLRTIWVTRPKPPRGGE